MQLFLNSLTIWIAAQLLWAIATLFPYRSWMHIDVLSLLLIYVWHRFDTTERWLYTLVILSTLDWHRDMLAVELSRSVSVLLVTFISQRFSQRLYIESYLLESLQTSLILIAATILESVYLITFQFSMTAPHGWRELYAYRLVSIVATAVASFIVSILLDIGLRHPHALVRSKR